MIEKNTFFNLGGMNKVLGSSSNEELELSLNIGLTEGEVLVRTDLICSYKGKEEVCKEGIEHSKEILKYKWKDGLNNQYISINYLINKFGGS
jgi:hypothetical protein